MESIVASCRLLAWQLCALKKKNVVILLPLSFRHRHMLHSNLIIIKATAPRKYKRKHRMFAALQQSILKMTLIIKMTLFYSWKCTFILGSISLSLFLPVIVITIRRPPVVIITLSRIVERMKYALLTNIFFLYHYYYEHPERCLFLATLSFPSPLFRMIHFLFLIHFFLCVFAAVDRNQAPTIGNNK